MTKFDYMFAIRPSVVCNNRCSYCFRDDDYSSTCRFNIESMLYHAQAYQNNLFNFCGYGETMIHPQFGEMISELSKVTKVNWVTNGTQFFGKQFELIRKSANYNNIHDVVVSVHTTEISDLNRFILDMYKFLHQINPVRVHFTTILTDENVDLVIQLVRRFPRIIVKQPLDTYMRGRVLVTHSYNPETLDKIAKNALHIVSDSMYDTTQPPYIGKPCLSGVKIFEVMPDGIIYDCPYDERRVIIGDINVASPIQKLGSSRVCKSACIRCSPASRTGCGLVAN